MKKSKSLIELSKFAIHQTKKFVALERDESVDKAFVERHVFQHDPYLSWFYRPHTLLGLAGGVALLIYAAFSRHESNTDTLSNYKAGIAASCCGFLLFAMLQFKDGLFYRPHPALWRIVQGAGVLYLFSLVFLVFQNTDDARAFFKYIDPSLGVPLPEKSYATDCRLYTPEESVDVELVGGVKLFSLPAKNIMDILYDRFVWAHLIGWWGKTLIFRDVYIAWAMSIVFEILELSLAHLLPNFHECWWDHIIVDVFGCNFLGIVLGMLTIRFFQMRQYDWTDQNPQPSTQSTGTVKKLLFQFMPVMDEFNWNWLGSWQRFMGVLILVVLQQGSEVSAFFLKYVLWIPADHNLNVYRLLLWWGMALPASRELYQFTSDPNCKKLGTNMWLVLAILGVETLINIKFGWNMFENATPPPLVQTCWLIAAFVFGLFVFWRVLKHFPLRKKGKQLLSSSNLSSSSSSNLSSSSPKKTIKIKSS